MLKFIDARCILGRRVYYREGSPKIKEDILEIMDRCGIVQAIAYHYMAKEYEMEMGNAQLIADTAGDARFLRQWCVMPNAFDEFLAPAELADEMKKNDVSSVRLLPKTAGYSLRPYASGKLMEVLAECHVPAFIDLAEIAWDDLYQLCADYPNVPIILTAPSYRCQRHIAPILDHCPNFHLGISNYVVHGGLRDFCKHYGAERLIFESGLPESSACAIVSLVNYAEISQEEKEKIASGNIRRLLSEVRL